MYGKWSPTQPFGVDEIEDGITDLYRSNDPSVTQGEQVRCCIKGCGKMLPRRRRKVQPTYCPLHGISMSLSPTYIYSRYQSNLIIGADLMNTVKKVETWRLPNERSEDALSWNVFLSLSKLGLLTKAFPELGDERKVELYLWGNRINTVNPSFWKQLTAVRRKIEPGCRFPTEPDIILREPGVALLLIEAKFGSPNGTLLGKEDRYESVYEFLDRYMPPDGIVDPLNRPWIEGQSPEEVLEQLCRNTIYATHLGDQGERLFVINLVRHIDEQKIESRFSQHLSNDSPVSFRRRTWEELHRVLESKGHEAEHVVKYLSNKTLGLEKAFSL